MDKTYPGKFLGHIYNYSLGEGVYRKEDNIFSSILGEILIDNDVKPPKISVIKRGLSAYKPKVGDQVYCKVQRVNKYNVFCDIIATKDYKLQSSIQAIIKSENVKGDFKEFDIFDCYVPGDIILAKIITTDLTNSIYLSTTAVDHGVVFAKSPITDGLMMPVSFDKMLCVDSGIYEARKVAKPKIN